MSRRNTKVKVQLSTTSNSWQKVLKRHVKNGVTETRDSCQPFSGSSPLASVLEFLGIGATKGSSTLNDLDPASVLVHALQSHLAAVAHSKTPQSRTAHTQINSSTSRSVAKSDSKTTHLKSLSRKSTPLKSAQGKSWSHTSPSSALVQSCLGTGSDASGVIQLVRHKAPDRTAPVRKRQRKQNSCPSPTRCRRKNPSRRTISPPTITDYFTRSASTSPVEGLGGKDVLARVEHLETDSVSLGESQIYTPCGVCVIG